MDAKEAAEQLQTIRRIMESATQITVLPGWAAIVGGLMAIAGCGVTYRILGSADFSQLGSLADAQVPVIALWVGLGAVATLIDIFMTVRMARRKGKNPWSRLFQLATYAMGPSLLAAFAISLALVRRGEWGLLPGTWILLYGTAVWMAGILSIHAPRMLGLFFLVLGVVTLFWAAPVGLFMVGLSFGMAHVVFGVYLIRRFGA